LGWGITDHVCEAGAAVQVTEEIVEVRICHREQHITQTLEARQTEA
jgi:hypothetical protein